MILTTHALVGAAVGKHIHNPFLLILILIPLHYLLDIFRHGEYLNEKSAFKDTAWKIMLDLLAPLGIILFSAYVGNFDRTLLFWALLGSFISMFPDLLTLLYCKLNFKFLKRPYLLHKFVHKRFAEGSPEREWNFRNALNDIIFSVIALFFLLLNF